MYAVIGYVDGTSIVCCINCDGNRLEKLFTTDILINYDLHHPMYYLSPNGFDIFVFNKEEAIHRLRMRSIPYEHYVAEPCNVYKSCMIQHSLLQNDENMLTLEERKQIVTENERVAREDATKTELSRMCSELGKSLNRVKALNSELPQKYGLGSADFEIDRRITTELQQNMDHKLLVMQKEIRATINGISAHNKRIRDALLHCLDHWPFVVRGFG